MLLANLSVATAMVFLTVVVHFLGLTGLIAFLRHDSANNRTGLSIWIQGSAILFVILVLFLLHAIEIWMFAALYIILGQFSTFEQSLYFATSTFTTVGFGDLVLDQKWRLLSAIESAAGFLMIGWSTAFLVSITGKLRFFEALIDHPHIEKAPKKGDDV